MCSQGKRIGNRCIRRYVNDLLVELKLDGSPDKLETAGTRVQAAVRLSFIQQKLDTAQAQMHGLLICNLAQPVTARPR